MEQSFGLIMGLGVGAAFLRRVRMELPAPSEDSPGHRLTVVSLLLLLVVTMWLNLSKNVSNWAEGNHIPQSVLGIRSAWWFLAIGVLLSAVMVVVVVRPPALGPASGFGRARMLLLVVLWIPVVGAFTQALPRLASRSTFLVQASFLITASLCSLIVVSLTEMPRSQPVPPHGPSDSSWRMGWKFWACLCLVPLLLCVVTWLTVASHDGPLPGSQVRFSQMPAGEPSSTRP